MSTRMIRPLALARILTRPPPDTPSTSILSRFCCASMSLVWASWAIRMMSLRSGKSRTPLFVDRIARKLCIGKGLEGSPHDRRVEHLLAKRLLGRQLLLAQRRLGRAFVDADLPGLAEGRLQEAAQFAKRLLDSLRIDRARGLQAQHRRRIADQPEIVAEMMGEDVLAAPLEPLDQLRKALRHAQQLGLAF